MGGEIVAIVAARGGSKGIPKKNIMPIAGKPMIVYSLEAAAQAQHVDHVFVTTDCDEIASVCKDAGFQVPYRRPDSLASDDATMLDTVLDAIDQVEKSGVNIGGYLLLQPTCPFRTAQHIDQAITKWRQSEMDALVSVHELREHPFDCITLDTNNDWQLMLEAHEPRLRRQDYKAGYYYINGAIYLGRPQTLREQGKFLLENQTAFYEMDYFSGIDIDDPIDLELANVYAHMK